MVQILPPKTNVGSQIGEALGAGLGQGMTMGVHRGMLQNALKGVEDLAKNPQANAFQLAAELMKATAGIPGAERYVGQLYPLLLQQMQSQAATGGPGDMTGYNPNYQQPSDQTSQQQIQMMNQGVQPQGLPSTVGAPAQAQAGGLGKPGQGTTGGLLGSIIPQDEIARRSNEYARRTMTGLQGYNEMQQNLLNRNAVTLQQRADLENKATNIGVPAEDMSQFMQIAQKYNNAATMDDLVKFAQRDYREYKNLSKTLDKAYFPSILSRLAAPGALVPERQESLKKLDNSVKRLVEMGFEQEVRQKLEKQQLSPTEVEERIHPMAESVRKDLNALPSSGKAKDEKPLVDFLKKNIKPDTSLLVLRQKLWQDKGYDWNTIATAMNEAISDPNAQPLTAAQQNEMTTVETEPPRQSLSYIFRDMGNIFRALAGQQ